jgi:hypothetical protein
VTDAETEQAITEAKMLGAEPCMCGAPPMLICDESRRGQGGIWLFLCCSKHGQGSYREHTLHVRYADSKADAVEKWNKWSKMTWAG